ncbi:MAG: DUF4159 domain-containing protein [Candidatus Poribacteria bacterium]|nr:DUF4159 domain-containing protein [Candidatus Poribacteria bacterium]
MFNGKRTHTLKKRTSDATDRRLSRRSFLKGAAGLAASAIIADQFLPASEAAFREYLYYDPTLDAHHGYRYGWLEHHYPSMDSTGEKFTFVRLKYPGGDWYTNAVDYYRWPSDVKFTEVLAQQTSIDVELHENPQYIAIDDAIDHLCAYPFIFMTGHLGVRFSEDDVRQLREYLERGGFLHVEDCDIRLDYGRGRMRPSVHRLMKQVFPDKKFERLHMSHPIFHTLYDHNEYLGGDKLIPSICDFDEAIMIEDRVAVYFCPSDLNCAWEGRVCSPGGEEQRQWAFEQGMNVVAYALSR